MNEIQMFFFIVWFFATVSFSSFKIVVRNTEFDLFSLIKLVEFSNSILNFAKLALQRKNKQPITVMVSIFNFQSYSAGLFDDYIPPEVNTTEAVSYFFFKHSS